MKNYLDMVTYKVGSTAFFIEPYFRTLRTIKELTEEEEEEEEEENEIVDWRT